jgi:SAM-dependent methyltransferase
VSERYTETAIHFDVERLPPLLSRSLPAGPLALADLGGDGPLFRSPLTRGTDRRDPPGVRRRLETSRLAGVSARFPWIVALVASADSVPAIPDGSLDAVIPTMVMEHVPDEQAYLAEIHRVRRPGGRAYVTTVIKRRWARYLRKRDGRPVLDTSHLREYTDLGAFRSLVTSSGFGSPCSNARSSGFPSSIRSCSAPGAGSHRIAARSARFAWQRCRSLATTASRSFSSTDADRC